MKKLFLFLFLMSCTSSDLNNNVQYEPIIFDENLTFDEFKDLLHKYSETAPYPNIEK